MYLVMARDNYPDHIFCDTYESVLLYIKTTYRDNNQGNDFVEYYMSTGNKREKAWLYYFAKHEYHNEILVINLDPKQIQDWEYITTEKLFERLL